MLNNQYLLPLEKQLWPVRVEPTKWKKCGQTICSLYKCLTTFLEDSLGMNSEFRLGAMGFRRLFRCLLIPGE